MTNDTRRAKGLNLVQLVKILKHQQSAALDTLGDEARAIIDTRVMMASWYPFPVFVEMLQLAHRLAGGSDEVAVEMGRQGGTQAFESVHQAYVRRQEPGYVAELIPAVWQSFFDFGRIAVERTGGGVEITVGDYPDVSRCHGHVVVGWCMAALDKAGATQVRYRVAAAPWLDGGELRFALDW